MTIKLLDWGGRETLADVGDLKDIAVMRIDVVTGDEILTVIYKDYSVEKFDSSHCRTVNFADDDYEIYNIATGLNLLTDDRFMGRTTSYWRDHLDDEEEEEA